MSLKEFVNSEQFIYFFQTKKYMNKKGITLIIISALMFGSYGVWARLIGDSFGAFFQGWTRGVIISLIILPILLWKKQIVPIAKKDRKWFYIFLLFTSMTQAPLFYAFNHMDIGSATLLFFVGMLITMYTVGILFLGEKLTKIKLISLILAGIGIYVMFSFSLVMFTLLAALLAVLNGVASGGEVSFSKKLSGNYSPLYITWLSWVSIIVINLPISILLGESQIIPSLNIVWLYQMGYSISSLFAFWLVIKGLKTVEAGIGGLIGLLEIVFSILLGILLFSEVLTLNVIIGAVLIMLAAVLPHVYEIRKKKRNQ